MSSKELSTNDKQALTNWANHKYIYRGHNPSKDVHVVRKFVNYVLGSCVFADDSAALALVEVSEKRYNKCIKDGDISLQDIIGIE